MSARRLKPQQRVVDREVENHGLGFGTETITLDCGHKRVRTIPVRHDIVRRPAQWMACYECHAHREAAR